MESTTTDYTPAPPVAGPWRLMGWDPKFAGSARWLSKDGLRGTRHDDSALTISSYRDAERACVEHVSRMSCALPRWMPVPITRTLDEMQETARRPNPATEARAKRPSARLGIPSTPFFD